MEMYASQATVKCIYQDIFDHAVLLHIHTLTSDLPHLGEGRTQSSLEFNGLGPCDFLVQIVMFVTYLSSPSCASQGLFRAFMREPRSGMHRLIWPIARRSSPEAEILGHFHTKIYKECTVQRRTQ